MPGMGYELIYNSVKIMFLRNTALGNLPLVFDFVMPESKRCVSLLLHFFPFLRRGATKWYIFSFLFSGRAKKNIRNQVS